MSYKIDINQMETAPIAYLSAGFMNLPRISYSTRHDLCQGSANAKVRIPATILHKGEQSGELIGYKSVKYQSLHLLALQRATLQTEKRFESYHQVFFIRLFGAIIISKLKALTNNAPLNAGLLIHFPALPEA